MQRRDRGTISAEVAIIAPALICLALFVHHAGRSVTTNSRVHHAAATAARAASLVRMAVMPEVARDAATRTMSDNGVACATSSVDVVVMTTADPMLVTVRVRCALDRSGMGQLFLGSREVVAEVSEVIDRWRAEK